MGYGESAWRGGMRGGFEVGGGAAYWAFAKSLFGKELGFMFWVAIISEGAVFNNSLTLVRSIPTLWAAAGVRGVRAC